MEEQQDAAALSASIVPRPLPGPALSVTGVWPSSVQISVDDASPNGRVALLYGFAEESSVMPNNFPCAGTTLGLHATARLGALLTADSNGNATPRPRVPCGACGKVFIQALDVGTCETSDVAHLQ